MTDPDTLLNYDDEDMTEAEQVEFMRLLQKQANSTDMAIMQVSNKAQELLNAINEL